MSLKFDKYKLGKKIQGLKLKSIMLSSQEQHISNMLKGTNCNKFQYMNNMSRT